MSNAHQRRKCKRLLEQLGIGEESMPQAKPKNHSSIEEHLSARKRSKRQSAVDFAGIFGLGFTWWILMEPRDSPHLLFASLVFLVFLFCFWSFLDDLLDKHGKSKIVITALVLFFFVGLEGIKIYNRIYRPNFCYGFLYVPPPYTLSDHKYRLGLSVANAESIENVSVVVFDISGSPEEGEDATKILVSARDLYVPIVYAEIANHTNLALGCDGPKEYLLQISTKIGLFQEELKCKDNDVAGQELTIYKFWSSTRANLVENWKPLNNKKRLSSWLLDLCD